MCLQRIVRVLPALLVLLPTAAFAQGSITGVVRDVSGAVLPGVTVEASSPALIEKVRSAVTDGGGQYRIVDLRPGTYSVSFMLTGFNAVRREGIELTGAFTATINAELRVGQIQETITVTGESPIVDVQTVTRQQVISSEVIDAIPSGRTPLTVATFLTGVQTNTVDVGGTNAISLAALSIHGGRATDQRVLQEGLNTANADGSGQFGPNTPNMSSVQELTVDTANASAETEHGGVTINVIPREGGNVFKGTFFASGTNSSLQGSNYTDDLRNRGLKTPDAINFLYDVNPGIGGPLIRDRAWFYSAVRWVGQNVFVGGMFANKNAGNPNAWTYEPDTDRRGEFNAYHRSANTRVTVQVTPKNKLSLFYDDQTRCYCLWVTANVAPEAATNLRWPMQRNLSANWTSPLTNRILLEAAVLQRGERFDYQRPPENDPALDLITVIEQSTGMTYRGAGYQTPTQLYMNTGAQIWNYRAALSYVTGAHAFKVGFANRGAARKSTTFDNHANVTYTFNNSSPVRLEQRASPWSREERIGADLGVYAQDRWTIHKLTVNLGARFDYFNVNFPEQQLGPARLVPDRDISFPKTDWVSWKDITPRLGVAYDVFGDGTTAIKASLNKYVVASGLVGPLGDKSNPVNRTSLFATRSWNDANRNYVPDCDLLVPTANGECGTLSDVNFGKVLANSLNVDPDARVGWGKRNFNWEFSTSVQREIVPKLSAEVGYFRRWYGNFLVTDNRATTPLDFDRFSITAPLDPRLPGGGGYTVSDIYNLNPARVGLVDNWVVLANQFGKQIEHWNGIDVTLNARLQNGLTANGGFSTGRTSTDNCEVVAKVDNPSPLYCHVDTPFQTQFKALAAYTVPRLRVQTSATFQSYPGQLISAIYNAPNAAVVPTLGRSLSGGAANVAVNLVEPGTMYSDRWNELDLRLGRQVALGRTRAMFSVDLYNALNTDGVLAVNNNYGSWLRPQTILQARYVKFGMQLDF